MTLLSDQMRLHPDQLDAYWMPFTANRQFKAAPRMVARAEGMHYWTPEGRQLLDGFSGLWCCNAGHNRKPIVEAIQKQAATMDYAPAFQMGQPLAFELANRIVDIAPEGMNHVFFCNSGSEAVDTALKIALAYHRVKGEGHRTRLIGRERGYHGVGFGGISVGGMVANRKMFGTMLAGVDHLPHTHDLAHNAFTRGDPQWGAHLADELERLVALHDASTIAAVIVEPMAGSTGVLFPPKGYLQAPARDHEQARHPAHLRRGDHGLRPHGRAPSPPQVYGVVPGHDHLRQGRHLGHRADGRRHRLLAPSTTPSWSARPARSSSSTATPTPRTCSPAPRAWRRSSSTRTRTSSRARAQDGAGAGGRAALAQGHAARDRHPQRRAGRRGGARAARRARRARAPSTPTSAAGRRACSCARPGEIICFAPALIVEESHIARMVDTLRAVLSRID